MFEYFPRHLFINQAVLGTVYITTYTLEFPSQYHNFYYKYVLGCNIMLLITTPPPMFKNLSHPLDVLTLPQGPSTYLFNSDETEKTFSFDRMWMGYNSSLGHKGMFYESGPLPQQYLTDARTHLTCHRYVR